jgi:hypothetical protein
MSYNITIQREARYADSFGPNAAKDKFRSTFCGVLWHWFPISGGYIIDYLVPGPAGKVDYMVVRHEGGFRNPVFIINLKRPSEWTAAGQQKVVDELVGHIKAHFNLTRYNTIYGLGGIGLKWMACRVQRSGDHQPTLLVDWKDNIASDTSYAEFAVVADLVYSLVD